jgi:hypothetical protein
MFKADSMLQNTSLKSPKASTMKQEETGPKGLGVCLKTHVCLILFGRCRGRFLVAQPLSTKLSYIGSRDEESVEGWHTVS